MSKVRYAVVGSGWRSLFYIRIAKALSETFELTALLCRKAFRSTPLRMPYSMPWMIKTSGWTRSLSLPRTGSTKSRVSLP